MALGVTLRVKPGTTVSFEHAKYGVRAGLNVYGTLIAEGTADRPIIFTSGAPQPEHGDWMGIHTYPGSAGSIFDHCIIEYGWIGCIVTFLHSVSFTANTPNNQVFCYFLRSIK